MPDSTSARVSGSSAAMCRYVKSVSPSRRRAYSAATGSFTLSSRSAVAPDLVDRRDPRADALVVGVGERAPEPGAGLDDDVVAAADELERAGRRQRDAVLVGLDLLGDADPQGRATISPRSRSPTGGHVGAGRNVRLFARSRTHARIRRYARRRGRRAAPHPGVGAARASARSRSSRLRAAASTSASVTSTIASRSATAMCSSGVWISAIPFARFTHWRPRSLKTFASAAPPERP